jgi:hypothetical protein
MPVARKQHPDIAELQPVIDALDAQDVSLAEIPERITTAFIAEARARANTEVPASSDGLDIDSTRSADLRSWANSTLPVRSWC